MTTTSLPQSPFIPNTTLPQLPLAHADRSVVRPGESRDMMVFRHDRSGHGGPDKIFIDVDSDHGTVGIRLTPAELVCIANTMLTDEERACINVPVAPGGSMSRLDTVALMTAILKAADEVATTVHNDAADDDEMWKRDSDGKCAARAAALYIAVDRAEGCLAERGGPS